MPTIEIAGWRVGLDCASEALSRAVSARFAPFVTAEPAHLEVQVGWEPAASAHGASAPAFPEARVRPLGGAYQLDAAEFCGRINLESAEAGVILRDPMPMPSLEYFIRVLYALLADRDEGVLIHAAGLMLRSADDPRGSVHLFIGQSGSGKSTVVSLSPQALALNDDLILLRPTGDRWIAHGTPFWNGEAFGRDGQIASGPVAGIHKLVQDRSVYLEPISLAEAAAELVANCPVVNADPGRLPGLLVRCRHLAAAVPVRRLHFRKDPSFWELLARPEGHPTSP